MLTINNLIIETTRKCNMSCGHCLRGEQQDVDINPQDITTLLTQIDQIGSIAFSGGEPSLAVHIIERTLQTVKLFSIPVSSFYIATNGKDIKADFILACLSWYAYCAEKDYCQVDVSNDYWHQQEGDYNTELLGGLSFFNRKHAKEGVYPDSKYMLNQGRYSAEYNDGRNVVEMPIETREDFGECQVYLNCNGDIINSCDWSYSNQYQHKLCAVQNLSSFVANLRGD